MEAVQLSLFDMMTAALPTVAVCCMDGSRVDAAPAESWMQRLVQGGEYAVQVAGHSMVLRPANCPADGVAAGHKYYPLHHRRAPVLGRVCGKREGENMSKENMGRNAEHYADPTPTAAMRNICRDEYQKEAARLDRIGDIVPLLRQMANIAGFEIIGRIPLRDKATGKEYR
ncbi:MAG: hypothetical protein [Bacteriophage sp.]|jgi:hypothetical protein|nr:MAG: hypothetical protein [Bacteriophage sp.]DAH18649.1 MAG TPA: hypothetical protein [Caudoviricetes sp.]